MYTQCIHTLYNNYRLHEYIGLHGQNSNFTNSYNEVEMGPGIQGTRHPWVSSEMGPGIQGTRHPWVSSERGPGIQGTRHPRD